MRRGKGSCPGGASVSEAGLVVIEDGPFVTMLEIGVEMALQLVPVVALVPVADQRAGHAEDDGAIGRDKPGDIAGCRVKIGGPAIVMGLVPGLA